jgi:hypothetical protein
MKAHFITRMSIQGSLLISLVSCSDATQFAEKTLPATLDAAKSGETVETTDPATDYNSTSPTGETPDGMNPDGTVAGTDPAGGTGTGTAPGAGPGTGTGGGAGATPPAVGEIFSECSAHPDKSIVSQLYQLPSQTSKLPDFSTMVPVGDVCVGALNIADRDFTQGFPGVSDIFEWFALDMHFKVTVPAGGNYQFFLNSDDGSILYIDGVKVIDNDGTHSQIEKSGSKQLAAGVHDFQVKYYQGPRTRIALELFWKTPGSNNKVYVPASVMSRP